MSDEFANRLGMEETNYGRNCGWIVEYHGEPVAILTDIHFEDMFWDSYRFEVTTPIAELARRLLTKEFCDTELGNIRWRNREFEAYAPFAFLSVHVFLESGRILMRGLYLTVESPSGWKKAVDWLKRLLKNRMRNS